MQALTSCTHHGLFSEMRASSASTTITAEFDGVYYAAADSSGPKNTFLEEGDSLSLQRSFEDVNMMEVSGKLVLLDRMPIDELSEKLAKRKSWDIVLIDSLQYTGMTYADYKRLRRDHPNKLFIFISHAKGNNPDGKLAEKVMYDSSCKIFVECFRADAKSRYLDKGQTMRPFVIWEERASLFWGDRLYKSNMEE